MRKHGYLRCLNAASARENISGVCVIHAGHDVLDCQCRHEFSDSNAWTVLTDVPSKELPWPLCTGWTLGWCRTLPMPVSIPSYGCCPVVVYQCLMLSHTQCNRRAWHTKICIIKHTAFTLIITIS